MSYEVRSLEEFMALDFESDGTQDEPLTIDVYCDLDFGGASIDYTVFPFYDKWYTDWDFHGNTIKNVRYEGAGSTWYFMTARNVKNVTFSNFDIQPNVEEAVVNSSLEVRMFRIKSTSTGLAAKFSNIKIDSSCKFLKFTGICDLSFSTQFYNVHMRGEVTGLMYFPLKWITKTQSKSYNYPQWATFCSCAGKVGGVYAFCSSTTTTTAWRCYRCYSANQGGSGYYFATEGYVRFCYVADFDLEGAKSRYISQSGSTVEYCYVWSESLGPNGTNTKFTKVDDITGELEGFEGTGYKYIVDEEMDEEPSGQIKLTGTGSSWSGSLTLRLYPRYPGTFPGISGLTVQLPKNSKEESVTAYVVLNHVNGTTTTELDRVEFEILPGASVEKVTVDLFTNGTNCTFDEMMKATNYGSQYYRVVSSGCSVMSSGRQAAVFAKEFFITGASTGSTKMPAGLVTYDVVGNVEPYMWVKEPNEFSHLDKQDFWCVMPDWSDAEDVSYLIWGVGQLPFYTGSGRAVDVKGSDTWGWMNELLYPRLLKTFILALSLRTIKVDRRVKK